MCRTDEKLPFAPWAEADHPDYDGSAEDTRYGWAFPPNWADYDTAHEWATKHPRLADDLTFIGQKPGEPYAAESDPFLFVDGDDVRCPETGDMAPEFVALADRLGITYADVSTSGTGAHLAFYGELPDGYRAATFQLREEPIGANDEPPCVEIYDGKRQFIFTGKHVTGTPDDVREVNTDALADVCEEHETRRETPTTDEHGPLLNSKDGGSAREPCKSKAEVAALDTTGDIDDVLDAVDHLSVHDMRLASSPTNTRADGSEDWDPHIPGEPASKSGTRLYVAADGKSVIYRDGNYGGTALSLVAWEEGIVSPGERLRGEEFWQAVEAARGRGANIPEYDRPADGGSLDYTPILPETRGTQAVSLGWDFTCADTLGTLSQRDVWNRTQTTIEDAIDRRQNSLLTVIMSGGKTRSTFEAAARKETSLTYLTGRHDLYEQASEICDDLGLTHYRLPSFPKDCKTMNLSEGRPMRQMFEELYARGATPKAIHEHYGDACPCRESDGDTTHRCPYETRWDFAPDDYEVLIGHYSHAHLPNGVTSGRVVAFDEFPGDAFTTTLEGDGLERAINTFLASEPGVPFADWHDLIENRRETNRRDAALDWFDGFDFDEPDVQGVFRNDDYHAYAPHAVYTLLTGNELAESDDPDDSSMGPYPFERTTLPGVQTPGVYFRGDSHNPKAVKLQTPPSLTYAHTVLGLDATGMVELWRDRLGIRLTHQSVLTDEERAEYVRDTLAINGMRVADHAKPYTSGEFATVKRDRRLFEAVRDQYGDGTPPVVFTSLSVERKYDEAGVVDDGTAKTIDHFAALRGTNRYAEERLAVVSGSPHYGDTWVREQAAFLGQAVFPERTDDGERTYGPLGNRIRYQMREAEVVQAALRVGRQGRGATVVFNTSAIPDWFPIEAVGSVPRHAPKRKAIVETVRDLAGNTGASFTTANVYDAMPDKDTVSMEYVRKTLTRLFDDGALDREMRGRGYVWYDDGVHTVDDAGQVSLPALTDAEREERDPQLAHIEHYMPELGVRADSAPPATATDADARSSTADQEDSDGRDPPDTALSD
ncbi:hypothetical protein [Halorubrum aidingense]|nr:hypothetical protein [Halorubrum aidingense]